MKICFLDRSTKLNSVVDIKTRARGGMVSSLFRISDYLAERGHTVYVISDIQHEGVTDSGAYWWHNPPKGLDFLITNRGTGDGYPLIDARKRILWTHDLPHNGFIPEPRTVKGFAATVFMSRFAERIWRAYYKEIGKSFYIPNGVDKTVFHPREKEDYLIFASAPNRGLERLPFILDAVRSRIGYDIKLIAYSNLASLHPNEVRETDEFDYTSIHESGVDLRDPVPQHELAKMMGGAKLLIFPSDYPEICSNVVLQSLASGTPIVTTGDLGATCEWVKHRKNGMLTEFKPYDYMVYTLEMVRNTDPFLYERLKRGAEKTKIYTWQDIGKRWEKMLKRLY
jgi:glycosyltransferase involved in cell wall biosynthesis